MSSPVEPADKSKPVLKEKNPHNYRKVGFSMIVVSVSLVLIGLLVWSVGSDYHFSSNIMAGQELTAMTPKQGYQIVLFDYSQPVGAKLKLLDHADSMDTAQKLQTQYAQQNTDAAGQVLIFDNTESDNLSLMSNAEVAAMTPKQGYNVILFNTAYPVGARLTLSINEKMLENATKYQQNQEDQIKDPDVKVELFTTSFTDNLKTVTGSNTPVAFFAYLANNQTSVPSVSQTTNQSATTVSLGTTTAQQPIVAPNQTGTNTEQVNINATVTTILSKPITNQTGSTGEKTNATANIVSKSITVNENLAMNDTTKK